MSKVCYKEISIKKGTIIRTHEEVACYSKVFRVVDKEADALLLYEPRLYIKGGEERLKEWVKIINKWGFPCEYLGYKNFPEYGITEERYLFIIPLKKYKYKNHMASALTLIRYTFEKDLESIVDNFFKVKGVYPKINNFKALRISNVMYKGGSGNGHTLHMYGYNCIYTKKEVMKKLKSSMTINEDGGTEIHSAWKGTIKSFRLTQNIKYIKSKMEKENLVYVVGGDKDYANWLPNFKTTRKIENADLVLFTGGEDVDPSLYGEPKGEYTYTNLRRDELEKQVFNKARQLNVKMLGICRGAQFLCAMSGGKLVQHQANPEYIHDITLYDGQKIKITSTHHQAAYPYNLPSWNYKVLGWTKGLSAFHLDGMGNELNPANECEIVYYRNTNALGIQGHPEFLDYQEKHPDSLEVLQGLFNDFINGDL